MKVMKTETYTIELTGTEKTEIQQALYEIMQTALAAHTNWRSNPNYLWALEQALRSA